MRAPVPERRFERKYPLSAAELLDFRWWHRTHGRAFVRAYDERTINNIYFDSPEWDRYQDNTSGMSSRTKCRLRWYGDLDRATNAVFEAKRRRNATGHKDQQVVSPADLGLADRPLSTLTTRLRPLLEEESVGEARRLGS